MMRAHQVLAAGTWPSESAIDRITLKFDERHRRRMRFVAAGGTDFLLDLPHAIVLRAGDGLRLEDGGTVLVEAAPEALVEVTTPDSATLVRLAWHIGNRHVSAELRVGSILIREDHVIVDMLLGLGASVRRIHAPFTPESGAYAAGSHGHGVLLPQMNQHDH
jgi:urease accessory protein